MIGFPSAKVVGGFDFAGDAYDASRFETFFPISDPDPMDCGGRWHACRRDGGGLRRQRQRQHLPAVPGTPRAVPTATMRIGPGVAPQASALCAAGVWLRRLLPP